MEPLQMPTMAGLAEQGVRLGDLGLIAGAILVVAILVNRYAPERRKHIARVVMLFGMHILAFSLHTVAVAAGADVWAARLAVVHDLFEAITLVSIVALVIFDVALPIAGIRVVSIVSDISVGIAYVVATLFVLQTSGMDVTSFVAVSTIAVGVLTFSMQETLGNVFGGIALQLDGSVHVDDWLRLENGREGRVKEIRWRHTVLETRDWDTVIVPNAVLLSHQITILGKREGEALQHRMWVRFNVDFRTPPTRVVEVVREALRAAPIARVALTPEPDVICTDLSGGEGRDTYGHYAVRYWLTDLAADDPTSSAIRARIWSSLKRAGIPLARPAMTMFTVQGGDEEDAARTERRRVQGIAALRSVELFRALTDEEYHELADHLVPAPFTAGETITRQGAVAHWLYVLSQGAVEVRTRVDNGPERVVSTLTGPDYFGEMGLLTGEARGASVVAASDVVCFRLDRDAFHAVVKRRPEIAGLMAPTLAKRRMELVAVREDLDQEAQRARASTEQQRILGRIQQFFGLHP